MYRGQGRGQRLRGHNLGLEASLRILNVTEVTEQQWPVIASVLTPTEYLGIR